jgi:hypothetical protein
MKDVERLRRILGDCYCRLQQSNIAGVGVFAIRDIPNRTNPFKTIKKYSRVGYIMITEDELCTLPPKLAQAIRQLFVPTDGRMYVPTCGTNIVHLQAYLNHSGKPNLRTRDGFTFTTRHRIREGEELTVDYETYGAGYMLHGPRRAVKRIKV